MTNRTPRRLLKSENCASDDLAQMFDGNFVPARVPRAGAANGSAKLEPL